MLLFIVLEPKCPARATRRLASAISNILAGSPKLRKHRKIGAALLLARGPDSLPFIALAFNS